MNSLRKNTSTNNIMEKNNIYANKITSLLEEIEYYSKVLTNINSDRKDTAEKIKELYKKNKNAEEVQEFAFDSFFIASFQNLDLQIMNAKFVNYVELYMEDLEADPLDDKVMNIYKVLKKRIPKRMFIAVDGKLEEIEKGSVEIKKEMYESRKLFSTIEKQVNEIMDVGKSR